MEKSMKALLKLFCCAMAVVCLGACAADDELSNLEADGIRTRAVVPEYGVSTSNPDLISDWENVPRIILNTLGTDTKNKSVTSPWTDGTISSLPETFRKDIKKEDGWKMLFHTFKEVGLDEKLNYLCFYNQFTGFIKVFYFYEGENRSQGTQWFLMTSEGQKVALLDAPDYLSKLQSEPATNNKLLFSNLVNNPTNGLEKGWNGFEFQVPRYTRDLTNIDFIIGAYDRQITNFNLLGKEYLNTVGTITSVSENSSSIAKGIANVAGPEAKKLIDKLGAGIFGDKVILGKSITKLIGSISGGAYVSAIKSGLNMIFGKTTTTTTSDVKLTTTGTVEIGGTSSTDVTAGVPPLSFNLYGVLNSSSRLNSNAKLVMAANETSGHHLGVWALKKKPVALYDRVSQVRVIESYPPAYSDGKYMMLRCSTRTPIIISYDIDVEINPDVLPYVKSYSCTINKYMVCDSLDGNKYKPGIVDIHDVAKKELLYADDDKYLTERSFDSEYIFEWSVPYTNSSQPTNYFYDWGNIKNGRILAAVSLNVTYSYGGKETEITQTGIYEVDSSTSPTCTMPTDVHHPPYVSVINYGIPHTVRYGWSQPYK